MSEQNKNYRLKKVVPVRKNGYILELQINDGLIPLTQVNGKKLENNQESQSRPSTFSNSSKT